MKKLVDRRSKEITVLAFVLAVWALFGFIANDALVPVTLLKFAFKESLAFGMGACFVYLAAPAFLYGILVLVEGVNLDDNF